MCSGKVIVDEIGVLLSSAFITLLGVHYTFQLAYNPHAQEVLEFLQENLIGDGLPSSRKMSAGYSNLFRAINCVQQKIEERNQEKERKEQSQPMLHRVFRIFNWTV